MLLVIGTVRIPAENLGTAKDHMRKMVEASRAEEGCIDYAYGLDVLDPGLIHVKEMWSDRAALDRHLASEHLGDWRAAWAELAITDRALQAFEVGEPQSV